MSNSEPNEELLDAYLDGELAGKVVEQVERRLETDADFRRRFEDYRALREAIQELPKHALGSDFSAQVLERVQAAATLPLPPPEPGDQVQVSARRATTGKSQSARRWLPWVISALAASVLLALVFPPHRPTNRIAVNVSGDPTRAQSQATKQESQAGESAPDHPIDSVNDFTRAGADRKAVREEFFEGRSESPVASEAASVRIGPTERAANDTDSVELAESASPNRPSLRYWFVDQITDARERQLNEEIQSKADGPVAADYLVPPSGFDEQQLLVLLKSRQGVQSSNSRGQIFRGGFDSEFKQNLEQSAGPPIDFKDQFVVGEKLKTNGSARCVVVEASVAEAADLLHQLDSLATSQKVNLVPLTGNELGRIGDSIATRSARPSLNRSVELSETVDEPSSRFVTDADKNVNSSPRSDVVSAKPLPAQDQPSDDNARKNASAGARPTLTEPKAERRRFRDASDVYPLAAQTDGQLGTEFDKNTEESVSEGLQRFGSPIDRVRIVFVFPAGLSK